MNNEVPVGGCHPFTHLPLSHSLGKKTPMQVFSADSGPEIYCSCVISHIGQPCRRGDFCFKGRKEKHLTSSSINLCGLMEGGKHANSTNYANPGLAARNVWIITISWFFFFALETKMFPERMKQSVKRGVAVRQLTDAHVLCYDHFYAINVDFRDREPSDGLSLKTTQAPFMCFHLLLEMYKIRRWMSFQLETNGRIQHTRGLEKSSVCMNHAWVCLCY